MKQSEQYHCWPSSAIWCCSHWRQPLRSSGSACMNLWTALRKGAFWGSSFLAMCSWLISQVRSYFPPSAGFSCTWMLLVLLKCPKSLQVRCRLSSQQSRSLQSTFILCSSLAEAPSLSWESSSRPCIRMKIRLAYRFSPRIVADTAPSSASLVGIWCSFLSRSTISSAPVLMEIFWTAASFWLAEAQIWRASTLGAAHLPQKMSLRRVMWPSSLQRTAPLSKESSSSCSYSSSAVRDSSSSSWNPSRRPRMCLMRLTSELVYCCMASSSHLLSSRDISLNSDFFVPSVYFSENFSNPSQSIIWFIAFLQVQCVNNDLFFGIVLEKIALYTPAPH